MNIDARFLADAFEILIEPLAGARAARIPQIGEKRPVGIELARRTLPDHDLI